MKAIPEAPKHKGTGMKSIDDILKMAQNVQVELEKAQATLDTIEVEGKSGGGLVCVRATAKGRIIGVSIDDSLMIISEKQILEDLVAAAFNDARAKADAVSSAEMAKMQNSMPLPPGFKLPF
jgi:nucleoid-associated protein EbfC